MKMTKACEWCGEEYETRLNSQRWCSYSCSAKNLRAQGKWGRTRKGVEAPCDYCGAITYKPMCKLRSKSGFYCSQKCFQEARSRKKRYIDKKGYVYISLERNDPYFPMCHARSRTLPEHRYVFAKSLGRLLSSSEQVHHINGVKDDNRLENLQLVMNSHVSGIRYQCCDCGSHNVEPVALT